MSLTTRIQDQKDHITQVKKDLCSKVGIPSEPLPGFSEIIGHRLCSFSLIIEYNKLGYPRNLPRWTYILFSIFPKTLDKDLWAKPINH